MVTIENKKAVEPAFVECPVPHRPGIDMDKAGMRVLTDAAALHRPGFGHRLR